MINVHVSGDNFDDIIRHIEVMEFPDLSPLVERCREIMLEDNREGLLAGTDADGDGMRPLKNSTLRSRDGDGPPLVPQYGDARIITNYQVETEDAGVNHVRLVGTWPGLPWVHYHVTGFHVRNARGEKIFVGPRNPVGIRPDGQELVRVALEDFARALTRS